MAILRLPQPGAAGRNEERRKALRGACIRRRKEGYGDVMIAIPLILAVVVFVEFAAAIFDERVEDDGSGGWKALPLSRRICYLAAPGLPLPGLVMFCALPKGWSETFSWYFPALAAPGLLLGLGNLALVFARRRRKRLKLWHGLLTATLLPSLALDGWMALVYLIVWGLSRSSH